MTAKSQRKPTGQVLVEQASCARTSSPVVAERFA